MFGIARTRQRTHAPSTADDLVDVVLRDQAGAEVRLGDTWSSKPAVLVWLRHYG